MPKVLIVEDDESMVAALRDGFEYEGYGVALAGDGAAGLRLVSEETPDLVILDVMLPKMNGMDVCREIRRGGNAVPIIMLTARGQEIDKVLGLKLGADDYVTKPFGFMELMARVEAVLRRAAGRPVEMESYRSGGLTVDFRKGEVRKKGRLLDLTQRELRLLRYFIGHRGEVVTREQLLDAVWDYDAAPITRTVDMHVAKLRKKIEDHPATPRFLVTVHGTGYKFTG
ncbi:MAG TPA: response regulator transcription factor [Candidatus Polarisedimenticolia bacterium]|nr:response regulator transcription factor [Candidatus Polarisedimenticolia bacterium]